MAIYTMIGIATLIVFSGFGLMCAVNLIRKGMKKG